MEKTGTLDSPRDFFEEVTRPNYEEFFASPSSFRGAFSLVMGLFNINEWVFVYEKAAVETKFGKTFASSGALWEEIQNQVLEARFIRDLSNASKHVKLKIKPSTSMTHITNTEIQVSTHDGSLKYNGQGRHGPSVVFHDRDGVIYLDDCARNLFKFWEDLINELYPRPPVTMRVDPNVPPQANS